MEYLFNEEANYCRLKAVSEEERDKRVSGELV